MDGDVTDMMLVEIVHASVLAYVRVALITRTHFYISAIL